MTTEASISSSSLRAWAQLVRLPNVFTVLADVGAAYLLIAGGPLALGRFMLVLAAGVSLYWAGMILNDVFDLTTDRRQRPTRPLPAGHISLSRARNTGWALLVVGIVLAAASGHAPGDEFAVTWLPAAVASLLAAMIVAYDGPLKNTRMAPAAMGSCRILSFLLGAAPLLGGSGEPMIFPYYLLGIAVGFGVYIMGITTMARREAEGGSTPNLTIGLIVMIVGAALLAFAPQLAPHGRRWFLTVESGFPVLIALIVAPVIIRAVRALGDPSPARVQLTIKAGVLGIIPLAAAFAFLGAGPVWGFAVFALVVPSLVLSARFRVT